MTVSAIVIMHGFDMKIHAGMQINVETDCKILSDGFKLFTCFSIVMVTLPLLGHLV